jgi:hypothetical protein
MHVRLRDNLAVLPGEQSMTATFPILGLCFVGASTNLRKATINRVCLSVRPHGTTRLPLDGFDI